MLGILLYCILSQAEHVVLCNHLVIFVIWHTHWSQMWQLEPNDIPEFSDQRTLGKRAPFLQLWSLSILLPVEDRASGLRDKAREKEDGRIWSCKLFFPSVIPGIPFSYCSFNRAMGMIGHTWVQIYRLRNCGRTPSYFASWLFSDKSKGFVSRLQSDHLYMHCLLFLIIMKEY